MRIRSLTLKNFRGFEDATVDLDRPLTVLCGVNGSGKSSVLMGCVLACARVAHDLRANDPQANETVRSYLAEPTDIRQGASALLLRATLSNGAVTREVVVRRGAGLRDDVRADPDYTHLAGAAPPLSVFYEASRGVAPASAAFRPTSIDNTFEALLATMVADRLQFRSFFQWFKAREDVENELKVAQQNLSLEDPQLAAVRRAVAGMLPGFSALRVQRDPLHLVVRKGETTLLIDQLSDGERLLLVAVADLARRLAIVHTGDADPLLGEAVVLIDEIELHLHPAWQRRVLADLCRTFPNCQFIVTTHSPQVLSEVPNEAVTVVEDFQFYRPAAPTAGRDSNAILSEVLGVPAHPHDVVKEVSAIGDLIDDSKDSEAKERLDRLAEKLTERDEEVARLRLLLDVVGRIDASDHEGA
jgi:predicted ATP-binding protein involved in virulence